MIVLLALVIRVGVVLADTGYKPANDALEYDYYARSIAAGDGYPHTLYLLQGGPTAIRGPGYPYFLGAIYALSGDSVAAGRIGGAVLGAVAVLFVYLIGRRIWGRRVGLVAAGLAAVFPPLILLSRDLLSESLFIVLELAAVLCVLNFRRSGGRLRWAAASGAVCGLAALTRNSGFVVLLAVALGLWMIRPRIHPRAMVAPAVSVVCAALAIAPWTLRNEIAFGRFIPVTTSAGISIAGTYNRTSFDDTKSHGAWRFAQILPEFKVLFATPGVDEATVDTILRRDAVNFAWHHPGYVAETSGWNLLRLFEIVGGSVVGARGQVLSDRGIGSADPGVERVGLAFAAVFAVLGVVAIFRSNGRRRLTSASPTRIPRGPLYLWLIPLLIVLTAAPVAGLPRYRLPADPFILMLAAIGMMWLWNTFPRPGWARSWRD